VKDFIAVLIAVFLCCYFNSSFAALNKWVDADGKVNYSDSPPADIKTKTLRSSSVTEAAAPAGGESAPKTLVEQEVEWKKSQKTKEDAEKKAAQDKENAALKQQNCDASRSNLATYEKGGNIAQYNAKGERTFIDEVARAQKIDEARKAVDSYCK